MESNKTSRQPLPSLTGGVGGGSASAWRENLVIPTYEVGAEEKNPIFLEKRVYQGSSGVVYPYPVIESIANEATPHEWHVVWLENEYLKVMIMPELGGRIQMAYDKIRQRHFVYYNHVIKPALVGLTGPWISGGIEFNWPQHHRPSTYLPVDCTIEEGEDGSVTVWCNEMERMFHQKGLVGFTLRPGCAYLEIQGRLSNRTPLPQTFLWWANPAVEVNDAYQSVFPPDVNAVFDHGKRAVSSFPIATGTYYKMDYSAGVDISNYKNIKVPTSYMAVNSKYDFEGGYENDTEAGMLHVASHHFSPGKKQWTWGNGDFGRAWDRNLTEPTPSPSPREGEFRPYIELMAGVYTENQPDFSWLMPYEEKQFTQYFMPYRELGIVKQASKDFLFSLTPASSPAGEGSVQRITLKVLATSKKEVRLVLCVQARTLFDETVTLSPEAIFTKTIDLEGFNFSDLHFHIFKVSTPLSNRRGGGGEAILSWSPEPDEVRPIPDAAEAALPPLECKTIDQLYLTGLHLEQYRHATWSALDYYEEALRRDPNDVRCLNQTGLWYLRRGRFQKAEKYLRQAVKVWQRRNPNPYDGEPLFNLAVALKFQGKTAEAYKWFWKSTWNKAWADAGYFEAARISVAEERYDDALDELERALISNSHNHQARALKAVVLRKLGRKEETLQWIANSYRIDPFNYVCMVEEHLLTGHDEPLLRMVQLMNGQAKNYHETALEYMAAELNSEAQQVLTLAMQPEVEASPLTYYYLAFTSNIHEVDSWLEKAVQTDSTCCFPNRLEDVLVLSLAKELNPDDALAPYLLGCLYYDKRQYDLAVENWELSAKLNPQFPTVWRNFALARFNKQERKEEAVELMERAFHLDETDARVLMELDQLYKVMQRPHQQRLDFLQQYPTLIAQRDDLVLEEITLLNQVGRYEEAMQKLDAHQFHPWEGGEGKVPAQYQYCRVELAKECIAHEDPDKAIYLLEQCLEYPHHLGEGKLYGAQENDFHYLLGIAYEQQGNSEQAREHYLLATEGPTEPAAAMYYNDAKPDKIFYAALAYRRLAALAAPATSASSSPDPAVSSSPDPAVVGQVVGGLSADNYTALANSLCYKLINYGQQHLFDTVRMDYFAVSLPDLLIWDGDLQQKNTIHCNLMMALGHLGLGHKEKALHFLEEVERLDINHIVPPALRSLMNLEA